ncbi:MAG: GNAT family N-acetyltransferase [Erysipelotrichaceae bacterium]|nr:GNAT family N-acetyltransferase [Erysipelotrichaceae bacterium]
MNIRVMTIDDYQAVYDLWLSCKGMGLNNIDDTKDGIDRFLKRNPDTCFVGEIDHKIVGVIMAGHDGRRGYIYHTAVSEKYHNHGIASQLVDKVINALYEIGISKVALVVFERNEAGNAFWEKQGFSVRNDLIYRNKSLVEIERMDT